MERSKAILAAGATAASLTIGGLAFVAGSGLLASDPDNVGNLRPVAAEVSVDAPQDATTTVAPVADSAPPADSAPTADPAAEPEETGPVLSGLPVSTRSATTSTRQDGERHVEHPESEHEEHEHDD